MQQISLNYESSNNGKVGNPGVVRGNSFNSKTEVKNKQKKSVSKPSFKEYKELLVIDTSMNDDEQCQMGDASENLNKSFISNSVRSISPKKSFMSFINAFTSNNSRNNPMRMLDPNETFATDKSFSVHES